MSCFGIVLVSHQPKPFLRSPEKRPKFEARLHRHEPRPMAPGWGGLSGNRRADQLHTFFRNGPSPFLLDLLSAPWALARPRSVRRDRIEDKETVFDLVLRSLVGYVF